MSQVYIFDFGDKIKVGYSTNVKKRLRTIELSSGVKAKNVYCVNAGRKEEKQLHLQLKNRLEGEFFAYPFDDAKTLLDKIVAERAFCIPGETNKMQYPRRYIYPAVITPEKGKYYVRVPDVPGCVTTGVSLEDAVSQITDALSACLVVLEDTGLPIPDATPQPQIQYGDSDIRTMVRVNTITYRARTDTRVVRKNICLPAWMAAMAEQEGINCSKVLQDALVQHFS